MGWIFGNSRGLGHYFDFDGAKCNNFVKQRSFINNIGLEHKLE